MLLIFRLHNSQVDIVNNLDLDHSVQVFLFIGTVSAIYTYTVYDLEYCSADMV